MSRKGSSPAASVLPDPKHGSETIARFINMVMQSGKKSVAEKIVYGAMDVIGEKKPERRSSCREGAGQRLAGRRSEVPPCRRRHLPGAGRSASSRRLALAMRWLIDSARKRGENTMPRKLAAELLDASENRGGAIKKREETHRMAEANKAFAHYRW